MHRFRAALGGALAIAVLSATARRIRTRPAGRPSEPGHEPVGHVRPADHEPGRPPGRHRPRHARDLGRVRQDRRLLLRLEPGQHQRLRHQRPAASEADGHAAEPRLRERGDELRRAQRRRSAEALRARRQRPLQRHGGSGERPAARAHRRRRGDRRGRHRPGRAEGALPHPRQLDRPRSGDHEHAHAAVPDDLVRVRLHRRRPGPLLDHRPARPRQAGRDRDRQVARVGAERHLHHRLGPLLGLRRRRRRLAHRLGRLGRLRRLRPARAEGAQRHQRAGHRDPVERLHPPQLDAPQRHPLPAGPRGERRQRQRAAGHRGGLLQRR